MNWTGVLFVGLLLMCQNRVKYAACKQNYNCKDDKSCEKLRDCFLEDNDHLVVPDNFNGVIRMHSWNSTTPCIIFLQQNQSVSEEVKWHKQWPLLREDKLLIERWHLDKDVDLYILTGLCNQTADFTAVGCNFTLDFTGNCTVKCVQTKTICDEATYDGTCPTSGLWDKNKYIISLKNHSLNCVNCNDPVKTPEQEFTEEDLQQYNITIELKEGEALDAQQAAQVMYKMADLASSINGSTVSLDMGEQATGILLREPDPVDLEEVSFAYTSPNASINIIEEKNSLDSFSRSLTVPKQAFDQAVSMNITVPFAAVFRFLNMANDSLNSTVLHNEVLAIEMGTLICNLTDRISINFRNTKYEGSSSCRSWNGEGSRPNWTDKGCETFTYGDNITCRCSHLTFFAILLAPPNQTISSHDLKALTTITQVGCGISMFFLAIVLFMHFLLRKAEASNSTKILINLVSSMFLLNLTFLINNFVAKMKSVDGCKAVAALMHYFMLATFTWFAVQAFHLCLQLYTGGKIHIQNYILKVCVVSWVLPSIVGIVLLILGKYGEELIHISDTYENVAMCWITDTHVHYTVNIGYYALVFVFTFTTFILILSWLFCNKITRAAKVQSAGSGPRIVTIMGLCCMLGISWGFAFFAHSAFLMPAYYIFTVLNSFQGFFLFIYYHRTSRPGAMRDGGGTVTSTSSNTTLKSNLDLFENPYINKGK